MAQRILTPAEAALVATAWHQQFGTDLPGLYDGTTLTIADAHADWLAAQTPDAAEAKKEALRSYLTARRYEAETAGTTLDLGNGVTMAVPTDRDGRAALKDARDMLRDGELLDEEGNVLTSMAVVIGSFSAHLTEPQATAILKRAGQHVQTAFEVQAAALTGINSGSITTEAQIDALDWPV